MPPRSRAIAATLPPEPPSTRPRRRFARPWLWVTIGAIVGIGAIAGVVLALVRTDDTKPVATDLRNAKGVVERPDKTQPTTTSSTRPALKQPPHATLPPIPGGTLGPGDTGPVVQAYQQRFVDLHFDPGPVDGKYGAAMSYAVQALQKIIGTPRTGKIGPAEAMSLAVFQYPQPLQADGEANRTEIDITKQVLTLYQDYQVRLITTTSSGSGARYCYNSPRVNPTRHICEYANTPSGRFTYTRFVSGWDKSPLGQLYNPYYFNGGIAVHGYESVPPYPASHGCTRIPMHIAEYFHTLVHQGDPVYVFGGKPAQVISSTPIAPPPPPPPTAAPLAPPPASVPPATEPPTTPPTTPPTSAPTPPST